MRSSPRDRTDTASESSIERSSERPYNGFGVALIVAAGLYRPLVLWADNAWEISNPAKSLITGLLIAAAAAVPYGFLTRVGTRPGPAAIAVSGLVFTLMSWRRLDPEPLVWLAAILILAWLTHRFVGLEGERVLLAIGVAVLLVAPLAQLAVAHVQRSAPYPISELADRQPAEATGEVEDVIVVIVDSYPSLRLAEEWFSHDASVIREDLATLGFTVESAGWSQHTFTGLAVPSLLELQSVVEPGPKTGWGHRMSTYNIIQGDSLTAASLRSAGFDYTHIESGWEAGVCGEADTCLEATWLDEVMWELLRPSIAGGLLDERLGSHAVKNSERVVDHIESIAYRFDDGERDFVFAHLLLPHPPLVVDAACDVLPRSARSQGSGEFEDLVSAQLSCADSLIRRIAEVVGSSSAVIITGDHGTATQGQGSRPEADWTDAAIAERLGVFLAYRLPPGCDAPDAAVNIDVMRAIISCAVAMELPERDERFMIGAGSPLIVPPARMELIRQGVSDGDIPYRSK